MVMKKIVIFLVALILAMVVSGCSEPSNDVLISQGRDVFKDKCARCHAINGQGGNRGPNLTKIGLAHDQAWLKSFLENPYSVKPDSTMPQISLSADEIDKLTLFLLSLK